MTIAQFTDTGTRGQIVAYDTTGYSGTAGWSEPVTEDTSPRPLPTERWLESCAEAVQGSRALRRALLAERGLRASTARSYQVGWDTKREVWILPVRGEWGELCNVTYRHPRGWDGPREKRLWRIKGRGVANGGLPLWPRVPFCNAWVLCGGEWDALALLQAGVPAVTGLCGCRWDEAWNVDARRKRIPVMYDVGEEQAAETTTKRLRVVGAYSAWMVTLNGATGFDPCDFFLEGGTRKELLRRIREAKRRQRP